jgi:hypothetical protein
VYIAITEAVQGRTDTSCERKIPLVSIKSVALSTFRDDWLVWLVHVLQKLAGAHVLDIAGPQRLFSRRGGPGYIVHLQDRAHYASAAADEWWCPSTRQSCVRRSCVLLG